ncbi:hypothetical protein [Sphingomonas sp. Leaf4]|uniref:hypothetical protein n=1 Tax=Sphingomonas sp. Leaf4 TaxID=2876553 RepID=UPI001E5B20C8|nr:hypothetical protein [Sphingomonas sp. Leaf4]
MYLPASAAFLLILPTAVQAQDTPALPSVAEAEANLARAQQVLATARILEAAEHRRMVAEAEAAKAREALVKLQQQDRPILAPVPTPAAALAANPGRPAIAAPAAATPPAEAYAAAANGVTTTVTATPDKVETKVSPTSQQGLAGNETGRQRFGGIDFGIGVAFSYDLGNNDRVKEAEIVNGIVRVTHTENIRARLILESHYFFTPKSALFSNYTGANCAGYTGYPDQYEDCTSRRKTFGIGPFMAVQPGSDNIIDAIGAGVMLGFRRREEKSASFNIGIGVLYDVDTQILGEGFVENGAPPIGETQVRFRRQSQSGLLIMTSYSF